MEKFDLDEDGKSDGWSLKSDSSVDIAMFELADKASRKSAVLLSGSVERGSTTDV
jgi:hypothetical protein